MKLYNHIEGKNNLLCPSAVRHYSNMQRPLIIISHEFTLHRSTLANANGLNIWQLFCQNHILS